MTKYCGIDPGLTGALAFLDTKHNLLTVYDMPTVKITVGDSMRSILKPDRLTDILWNEEPDEVLLEKVHSTPNDGHVGAFTFGKATGIVIGVVVALDFPLSEVTAGKWKKDMRVPADKEEAMPIASKLLPTCKNMWARKKDHGRAEAALISLYAAIRSGFQPSTPITPGKTV